MARVVVGFNHNIKHRGKMYHIQTEDSGLENPQLTTHLFVGGNILASKKRSYAELLGADDLARTVRELMEAQHKEVLRNLINGVYDGVDAAHAQRGQVFQPGEIQDDGRTVTVHAASPAPEPPAPPPLAAPPPGPDARAPSRSPAAPALPPEVVAAREGPAPALRDDGAETLFGEDLISDRSLDEVILSYLAEELGDRT